MSRNNGAMADSTVIAQNAATSGLSVNLHPLAILNISDHYTRAKCIQPSTSDAKLMGALLGTANGRDVSIQNSFELVHFVDEHGAIKVDEEFFATRREQFSQVFPTLSVVGWYTIRANPEHQDILIHEQVIEANESGPSVLVVFNPDIPPNTKHLPFTVYESALPDGDHDHCGKFVEVECGIETGEAERIAVDGVTKDSSGEVDQSGEVSSLTMQRNAIQVLYDRALLLRDYVASVVDDTGKVDHAILRQISAIVATLPVMDVGQFQKELVTEHNDVQLATYLTTILQQLEAFADYADKHVALHPQQGEELGSRTAKPFGNVMPQQRTRRTRRPVP